MPATSGRPCATDRAPQTGRFRRAGAFGQGLQAVFPGGVRQRSRVQQVPELFLDLPGGLHPAGRIIGAEDRAEPGPSTIPRTWPVPRPTIVVIHGSYLFHALVAGSRKNRTDR